MLLVKIEKYRTHWSLRILTGKDTGLLVSTCFDSEEESSTYAASQGYELVRSTALYKRIEIVKGVWNSMFYAFDLDGNQVLTDYSFRTDKALKDIIDWHTDYIEKGLR